MTLEIGLLLVVLGAMVYLFLTEKLPVDLTAFLGLIFFILLGFVPADRAFSGFSSPAVITMLSIFIVSASLLYTGIADVVGGWIHRRVGGREVVLIVVLMLVGGILSAFMNNIAATAVLMPAVGSICRKANIPPARLFMPLAFGAILGGTTTLVGTPPNILAAAMLEEAGEIPFSLFDFTPMGLVLLGVGTLYMVTIGRRLIPVRQENHRASAASPMQAYQLNERLFSLRIPEKSPMDGLTLGEARLGTALSVQVAAIVRGGQKKLAPEANAVLRAGDILLVEGEADELNKLLRMQGTELVRTEETRLPRLTRGVTGIRLALSESSTLRGQTLRDLSFRDRFGLMVVAIRRRDRIFREHLGDVVLERGDELLALGPRAELQGLEEEADFEVQETGLSAIRQVQEHLYLLRIPESSALVGQSVQESRLGQLVGLTVAGIIRDRKTHLAVEPEEVIRPGDELLLGGSPDRIVSLLQIGEIQLESTVRESSSIESDSVGVVEAVLAPRSSLAGKSLTDLNFRDRFGLQVLAMWSQGEAIHSQLATRPLRFGDALLLQGERNRIDELMTSNDLIVLRQADEGARRTGKAWYALGGLALMVALVVTGVQPIHVAAFISASLVILCGALKMEEAYREIEWKAIFLVAAVLPVGIAMEKTGAASLLAENVAEVAGPLGPYAVLTALVVLSSLLSQALDGAPAVVLLTPVVLETAQALSWSPYPLMMGVSLAASAAFMTPFSHKANLLVMSAGGYRASDYVRVGTPLTIVVLALMVGLIPLFFPF